MYKGGDRRLDVIMKDSQGQELEKISKRSSGSLERELVEEDGGEEQMNSMPDIGFNEGCYLCFQMKSPSASIIHSVASSRSMQRSRL